MDHGGTGGSELRRRAAEAGEQQRAEGAPTLGRAQPFEVVEVPAAAEGDCPGRKPPLLAVKHPVRPYKSTIENRFT